MVISRIIKLKGFHCEQIHCVPVEVLLEILREPHGTYKFFPKLSHQTLQNCLAGPSRFITRQDLLNLPGSTPGEVNRINGGTLQTDLVIERFNFVFSQQVD